MDYGSHPTKLIPSVRSAPRRGELPGVGEGTRRHGAQRGSKAAAEQVRFGRPKKCSAQPNGRVLAEICFAATVGPPSMRQIGVGTSGGAEALAVFHHLLYNQWMTGSLSGPLARIKVDEKNCFGMIEWKAVREAASRIFPKHAEQGDIDGPLSAAWQRRRAAAQQAAGSLPWIGVDDPSEEQRLQADHATRMQESVNFQLGGPEKFTGAHDPQHALQKNGGLADLSYRDDGGIMCHPILVPPFLQEFGVANAKVGAERNPQKTQVIYHVNDLDAAPLEWEIRDVQSMAKVSTVTTGSITPDLGSTSWTKSWAKQTSFEQCTNASSCGRTRRRSSPSSERVWELAVSTTFLRVHGHPILQEQRAAEIFDEVGQRSLEWLLLRSHGGQFDASDTLGYKRARDIAAPTHLGDLIAAKDAVWAGLLPEHPLETRLAAVIETCHGKVVCSEGGSGSRRSLAANNWRIAGTRRHKPDHRIPRTSWLRLSR